MLVHWAKLLTSEQSEANETPESAGADASDDPQSDAGGETLVTADSGDAAVDTLTSAWAP